MHLVIHLVLDGRYPLCPYPASTKREGNLYAFPASTAYLFSEKKWWNWHSSLQFQRTGIPNPGGPFPFSVPKKTLAHEQCLTGKKFSAKQKEQVLGRAGQTESEPCALGRKYTHRLWRHSTFLLRSVGKVIWNSLGKGPRACVYGSLRVKALNCSDRIAIGIYWKLIVQGYQAPTGPSLAH